MLFFSSGVQVSMQLLRSLFFLFQLADTWSTRGQLFPSSGYRNIGYDVRGLNFWSFMKESPLCTHEFFAYNTAFLISSVGFFLKTRVDTA